MTCEILTTGYEGEHIEQFVQKLINAGVELVIDVRYLPLSRKPGFSKTRLRERLEQLDIDYVHLRDLGMPDELRSQRSSLSNNASILDAYDGLLVSRQDAVNHVAHLLRQKRGCLLCFEADPARCHRSRLAQHLVSCFGDFEARDLVTELPHLSA